MSDTYDNTAMIPSDVAALAGPRGPALVKVFQDGRTQTGWGDDRFMDEYQKGSFDARRSAFAYRKVGAPFAFIMRSLRIVVVDIDGKNGGFDGAKQLGNLPYTLAETSKSGNGYHLFFYTDEEWDTEHGFDQFSDYIGVEQGVDIRATGCIYHHNTQRWNERPIAPLPKYLAEMFAARKNKRAQFSDRIQKIQTAGDDLEMLMIQDELMDELKKPVADGKRNNTLFAIGSKMCQAEIPDWQEALIERAIELDLDREEGEKLVANITRYVGK